MAFPSAGMGFPLYELFMETTPYPRSTSCGRERKGLRRSATDPDLRQARVNWRRYHIARTTSIMQPVMYAHLWQRLYAAAPRRGKPAARKRRGKPWSWIGTNITRKSV